MTTTRYIACIIVLNPQKPNKSHNSAANPYIRFTPKLNLKFTQILKYSPTSQIILNKQHNNDTPAFK